MPIFFMDVIKVNRGFYEILLKKSLIIKKLRNFKLTDIFIKMVEDQIYRKPEFYTWTTEGLSIEKIISLLFLQ